MHESDIQIGKAVIYYAAIIGGEKLYPRQTRIRSAVWPLGSGELVCKVDGIVGGVSLAHLEPR